MKVYITYQQNKVHITCELSRIYVKVLPEQLEKLTRNLKKTDIQDENPSSRKKIVNM